MPALDSFPSESLPSEKFPLHDAIVRVDVVLLASLLKTQISLEAKLAGYTPRGRL